MRSTQSLQGILDGCCLDSLEEYWEKHREEQALNFPRYMEMLFKEKQMTRREVLRRADIPEKYGYKILDGTKKTRDRDRLLQIFIAMRLNVDEVRRGLELYGMPSLYPRNQRDNVFYLAFKGGCWSVEEVDKYLRYYGLKPLSIGIEGD